MSEVAAVPAEGQHSRSFAQRKFFNEDFSGQNLARADFRGATLRECNFRGADLSYANFEGANCWGAVFTDAVLYRTNFKDAILAMAHLDARDCFGMTLTLACDTLDGVQTDKIWWAWLFMATLMKGPDPVAADKLIALFGVERYVRYKEHFRQREL